MLMTARQGADSTVASEAERLIQEAAELKQIFGAILRNCE